jgi:hypothetical protein
LGSPIPKYGIVQFDKSLAHKKNSSMNKEPIFKAAVGAKRRSGKRGFPQALCDWGLEW